MCLPVEAVSVFQYYYNSNYCTHSKSCRLACMTCFNGCQIMLLCKTSKSSLKLSSTDRVIDSSQCTIPESPCSFTSKHVLVICLNISPYGQKWDTVIHLYRGIACRTQTCTAANCRQTQQLAFQTPMPALHDNVLRCLLETHAACLTLVS
jgi:hypothetical protein